MIEGFVNAVVGIIQESGFLSSDWRNYVMIGIACVLLYLAIARQFEPLLLLPIAFGMLLVNVYPAIMAEPTETANGGLFYYLYQGVKLGIYPPLIFLGVGAMTDFGPLIARPSSFLLGAAAQLGIFLTFLGALALGFTPQQSGAIGIIGGADGPTAIYVTSRLAPELLGPIAVAAYSYMALVPVIQPPIMKLLTTKKETQHCHGTAAAGFEAGKDPVPGHRYGIGLPASAGCCPADRHVDAWQPDAGKRRGQPSFEYGSERIDEYHHE